MEVGNTRTKREKRKIEGESGERKPGASRRVEGIGFFARADCGCCEVGPMIFVSEESALKAFEKIGLRNGGTIVDDAGEVHEGIDTFYGFWRSETSHRTRDDEPDRRAGSVLKTACRQRCL